MSDRRDQPCQVENQNDDAYSKAKCWRKRDAGEVRRQGRVSDGRQRIVFT